MTKPHGKPDARAIAREADALDRRLATLPEAAMRRGVVREVLESRSPAAVCALASHVLQRAPVSGPLRDSLREAVLANLLDAHALSYERLQEIYAAAVQHELDDVRELLRSRPVPELQERAQRLPVEIAEIPLGRRRSLAKGEDRFLLERLALDPDPLVIRHLLRNPRFVETDVLKLASARPAPASTLQEIAQSERWSPRPRVRLALARNPTCPGELALQLIGTLALPDLRTLARDPDLPPATARAVAAEVGRRTGGA
ncbi:MAG: hypothetical protein MJE66_02070 [Proteobacteria bacterium]|nr:hypothetical protein [Pseudomonadota bacterium]